MLLLTEDFMSKPQDEDVLEACLRLFNRPGVSRRELEEALATERQSHASTRTEACRTIRQAQRRGAVSSLLALLFFLLSTYQPLPEWLCLFSLVGTWCWWVSAYGPWLYAEITGVDE